MDVKPGASCPTVPAWMRWGAQILERVEAVAAGERTSRKSWGHQEFILTYKSFEPIGPALPGRDKSVREAGSAPLRLGPGVPAAAARRCASAEGLRLLSPNVELLTTM